jgi:hypothetical protein
MSRYKVKKVGLNKVEKKQVNAIINAKSESKYFQSVYNLQNQSLKFQSSAATENEIMVRGFAVGTGEIGGVAGTYGYESIGGAARVITPIHMARTFDSTVVAATEYEGMIPDGKYVSPAMTKCTWRIHRNIVDTGDAEDLRTSSPYIVRLIRVRPRNTKFSDVDYVPSLDLFVNNYGIAYGVDSPASTYQKNFGLFEMLTSKINSRKYKVVQDTQFQLSAPNINTQLGTDLIATETNSNHQKLITTNHDMPKKLYYSGEYDNGTNRQPLAGQSSELIFWHVGVVGTTTKDIGLDVDIDCKPISTFKDL